mmetsp:Transcript_1989/g.6903  ORF Transcript_1989/g.6903 Transcript_1989/m.6903 type:complete len:313 (-) Transcript_1989:1467-2405(-)
MDAGRCPELLHLVSTASSIGVHLLGLTGEEVHSRFAEVVEALRGVTFAALRLDSAPISDLVVPAAEPGCIRYLEVLETEHVSIGMFILPPHASIPLHDHPHMCVASNVLHGVLMQRSLTRVADTSGLVPPGVTTGLLERSESLTAPAITYLTEESCNIHSFTAGADGCIVLDCLIPPYESKARPCSYFAEFDHPRGGEFRGLVPFNPPDTFNVQSGYLWDTMAPPQAVHGAAAGVPQQPQHPHQRGPRPMSLEEKDEAESASAAAAAGGGRAGPGAAANDGGAVRGTTAPTGVERASGAVAVRRRKGKRQTR